MGGRKTSTAAKAASDARAAAAAAASAKAAALLDDDSDEVDQLMDALPPEQLTQAKLIAKIIAIKFDIRFDEMKAELENQHKIINDLNKQVSHLTKRVNDQEKIIDDLQQYSRRDCVIFSGESIPAEARDEDVKKIVID